MPEQIDWRFCIKCHAMFFDGSPHKGACARGGGHQAQGFMFIPPHTGASGPPTLHLDRPADRVAVHAGPSSRRGAVRGTARQVLRFNGFGDYSVHYLARRNSIHRSCARRIGHHAQRAVDVHHQDGGTAICRGPGRANAAAPSPSPTRPSPRRSNAHARGSSFRPPSSSPRCCQLTVAHQLTSTLNASNAYPRRRRSCSL
jgi:hypothetical protein